MPAVAIKCRQRELSDNHAAPARAPHLTWAPALQCLPCRQLTGPCHCHCVPGHQCPHKCPTWTPTGAIEQSPRLIHALQCLPRRQLRRRLPADPGGAVQLGPPCQQRRVALAPGHIDQTGDHVLADNISPAGAAWTSWSIALPRKVGAAEGQSNQQAGPGQQHQSCNKDAVNQDAQRRWGAGAVVQFCSIMGTQLHEGTAHGKAHAQAPVSASRFPLTCLVRRSAQRCTWS